MILNLMVQFFYAVQMKIFLIWKKTYLGPNMAIFDPKILILRSFQCYFLWGYSSKRALNGIKIIKKKMTVKTTFAPTLYPSLSFVAKN